MAKVYSIMNQKGGVGKTTTAINLGAFLALKHYKVLLIDIDPQGNATSGVGIDQTTLKTTVYDTMINGEDIIESIYPTSFENLHVLPSNQDLIGAEIELAEIVSRETVLEKALSPLKQLYDYILIDCPPSLGILTVNGLTASDEVIIPIQCEYYALEGLGYMVQTVDLIKQGLNPTLKIAGLLLTMYDRRTMLNNQVVDEVRNNFKGHVFKTIIPRSIRLGEAPSHGLPIAVYFPTSTGSVAYEMFADEIIVMNKPVLMNPDLSITNNNINEEAITYPHEIILKGG